jgi:hypothetical protein
MRIEIPIIKQGKTVKIYNEGEYYNKHSEIQGFLNKLKPEGADKDFVKNSISNLLKKSNENYHGSNGWVFSHNNDTLVFVKIDKIPQYHSFESIAKQLI